MDEKEKIRREVWVSLQKVARPDSRFHWDFTAFIPDYTGSEICAQRIRAMPAYQQAGVVLATPDNNLEALRLGCLLDGKLLVVPTYAIGRGFLCIEGLDVPAGSEALAASLDGLDRFARPYLLEEVPPQQRPNLLITGASVVNQQGVRLSVGPSYFDLEWLILSSLRIVPPDVPIIAAVHDCQVVDWPCAPLPYSVVMDRIVTPTQVIETGNQLARPGEDAWSALPWHVIQEIPFVRQLWERKIGKTGALEN
jgi:5-formyltetrahydrofolate cyclo-ligase